MIKSLMLLLVLAAAALSFGCTCANAKNYPHDTFIGASGWPSTQVPLDHVALYP